MLKGADAKEWMKTDLTLIKEDVKVSFNGKDSIVHISTQYQTTDNSKFTRVITDTLNKNELQSIIQSNKNAVYVDKILATPLKWKFIGL
ncbi:MAG TPA: hypothetical protein VLR49_06230, partial [Ferruginibacter sp.]|nr:hypothetical protein [Ferruginibacter sp.]